MADLNRPIKNVAILGATGNIGRPIIDALLAHPAGYTVTAITRKPSESSFSPAVRVVESDYSDSSLSDIFTGQDAIISCIPGPNIESHRRYIEIAISRDVARFVPSEFGMDTAKPEAIKWRPGLIEKVKIVDYLKSNEDKITWTAFITGGFFDWGLVIPGGFGMDIRKRAAVIYDGGDVEWEATNLSRVGQAVASSLSPQYQTIAANQMAYVNSFTLTQNKLLAALERQVGEKFKVTHDTTQEYRDRSYKQLEKDPTDKMAALGTIQASLLGLGGINRYSKEREMWNEKLGLEQESLETTLSTILSRL